MPIDGTHALGEGPQESQDSQEFRYALSRCMTCGCCLEACPQFTKENDFVGAQAIAQALYFNEHQTGKKLKGITPAALDLIQERDWPGNVRELKNVVERMAILSGDLIQLGDLNTSIGSAALAEPTPVGKATISNTRLSPTAQPEFSSGPRPSLREYREQAERQYIVDILHECSWNISKAAALLHVERTNLHKKMRAYGIARQET